MVDQNDYGTDQIRSLQNVSAIRQMPAMYLGNLNSTEQLVYEVIDNSIDEFMAGFGTSIDVHIYKDFTVEIIDHARGIPVGPSKIFKDDNGKPIDTLTGILTTLHSGGKYTHGQGSGYKTATGGLHGCGLCATNACSDLLTVTVKRNGNIYEQTFERGVPVTDVKIVGKTNETGTTVKYHPDNQIFKVSLAPSKRLENRLVELASLNSGLTINYINDNGKTNKTFYFENGIKGYTLQLIENKKKLYNEPFYIHGEYDNLDGSKIIVDISFIHDDEVEPCTKTKAFVNSINTYEFGTHVTGFRAAYRSFINKFAAKKNLIKDNIEMRYLEDGLYSTIALKMTGAEFEGQTKTKLGNAIAQEAVEHIITDFFEKQQKNKEISKTLETIVNRAVKTKEAEEAARAARTLKRQTNKASRSLLPSQLADCVNAGTGEYAELIIVEGNSASGCQPGYSKIKLANGKDATMLELLHDFNNGKINYIYCCDKNGKIHVQPITNVFMTRHVNKLYRIKLDNEEYEDFTGNHLIMMRDGTYKRADEIQTGDSIMSVSVEHNHTVKSIDIINCNEDVYDITVPEYHNYALSCGIFVHNSAKSARNPVFQSVLPLRGKVLNVEKSSIDKMLNSPAIQRIIAAIGAGVGKAFDISKVRYDKIIIEADSDSDGSHIRALVLTLFYRYMPGLIEKGYVYAAQPPLYKVTMNGQSQYLADDRSLNEFRRNNKGKNFIVNRFKG